jgi:hypothetical protein
MRHIVSALIYNAITIGIVYVFLLWWHGSHDIMVHEKFRRPRCALALARHCGAGAVFLQFSLIKFSFNYNDTFRVFT